MMILNSQRDPSKQIEGIYLVATEEGPRAEKETCFLFYLVPPPRTSFTLTMLPPLTKGRMKLLRDKESNLCDSNLLIQRKDTFKSSNIFCLAHKGIASPIVGQMFPPSDQIWTDLWISQILRRLKVRSPPRLGQVAGSQRIDRSPKEAWEGFLIAVGRSQSVTHSDTHLAKCLNFRHCPIILKLESFWGTPFYPAFLLLSCVSVRDVSNAFF